MNLYILSSHYILTCNTQTKVSPKWPYAEEKEMPSAFLLALHICFGYTVGPASLTEKPQPPNENIHNESTRDSTLYLYKGG